MAGTLNGNIELNQTYLVWHTLKLDGLTPPSPSKWQCGLELQIWIKQFIPPTKNVNVDLDFWFELDGSPSKSQTWNLNLDFGFQLDGLSPPKSSMNYTFTSETS